MIRVFLLDDHEIVRRGLAEVIDAEPDLKVVGEASTAHQAVGRIAATSPDVAILDVHLPDGSGIDVCRELRSSQPAVQCLILTAFDDDQAASAAVLAGASGYALKDIRGHDLVESVRRVARGENILPAIVNRRVVERIHATAAEPGRTDLTARERQVLGLIADGLTNRQIGERLELAEKTVKNYVSGLLAKLGMERRTQAAVYGARFRGK
ncbi:MAG: response regulator transcription factor [Actinomycetota bacterium]|nr:response regulator transcription factor [Actinomycetota bacterium]